MSAAHKISELLALVDQTSGHRSAFSEKSDRLTLSGAVFPQFSRWVQKLFDLSTSTDYLSLEADEIAVDDKERQRIVETQGQGYSHWSCRINKNQFLQTIGCPEGYLFFYRLEDFQRWLQQLNPFACEEFLATESPKRILVFEAAELAGGPHFLIVPPSQLEAAETYPAPASLLPTAAQVRSQVRVHTSTHSAIRPALFQIDHLSGIPAIDEPLLRNSYLTLAAALANDFYGPKRVRIKGLRRLELPLLEDAEKPTLQVVKQLEKAVAWCYEERPDTRLELLCDRLSLELSKTQSLYAGLQKHLEDAFQQARDQYRFVILNRKDAYYRELRNLLSGLQHQSRTYNEKIKAMTEALFRDVLAALFLTAFGLLSKTDFDELEELLDNEYMLYLLKGLAIYYFVSLAFQLWNNHRDLTLSRRELDQWIATTRNYLSKKKVENIINEAIQKRRQNYNLTVRIISVVYVIIGLFLFFIGEIF